MVKRIIAALLGLWVFTIAGTAQATCPTFGTPTLESTTSNPDAAEVSGIVMSDQQTSLIWMVGDSGQPTEVWATNFNGADLATVTVSGFPSYVTDGNVDWEALSWGPDDDLFIGDIGDNAQSRSEIRIYRIDEPTVTDQTVNVKNTYTYTYADGLAHNAESMFISGGKVFIIQKNANGTLWRNDGLTDTTLENQGDTGLNTTNAADIMTNNAGTRTVIAVKSIAADTLWWYEVTTNPTSALLNDTPCTTSDIGSETVGIKHNLSAMAFGQDESVDPGIYKQTVT
jgi:hypothetical protein